MLIAVGLVVIGGKWEKCLMILVISFFMLGWYNIFIGESKLLKEDWRGSFLDISQAGFKGEKVVFRVLQIAFPSAYYYSGNLPIEVMEIDENINPLDEISHGAEGVWLVYWNIAADAHLMGSNAIFQPELEDDPIANSWVNGDGPEIVSQKNYPGVTVFHFKGPFE